MSSPAPKPNSPRPSRLERLRRRALLGRTFAVLAALALGPLVFSSTGELLDAAVGGRLARRLEAAASTSLAQPDQIAIAANQAGAHLVIFAADGAALAEVDRERDDDAWTRAQASLLGPRPAPNGPDAAVLEGARLGGRLSRCTADGLFLACEVAVSAPDGRLAWAARRSRRGPVALADLSGAVAQASLLLLALAGGLGSWLAAAWLRPIRRLERDALARTADPLHAPPLPADNLGELTDLAQAFNAVLAAVRGQAEANEAFIADLAHEMKSPVAAIQTTAESLATHPPTDPERLARHARVLAVSAARLDGLLARFLALARAQAGLTAEARAPVPLHDLVATLGEGAVLRLEPAHVPGVAHALEGAVRNLFENARAFAGPEGEVRATLSVAKEVTLEVEDSGPGVPEEIGARVFERFFTTRGGGRGTGLGLALVKAVAEAHGGHVAVDRSPALGGARFTLTLPAA